MGSYVPHFSPIYEPGAYGGPAQELCKTVGCVGRADRRAFDDRIAWRCTAAASRSPEDDSRCIVMQDLSNHPRATASSSSTGTLFPLAVDLANLNERTRKAKAKARHLPQTARTNLAEICTYLFPRRPCRVYRPMRRCKRGCSTISPRSYAPLTPISYSVSRPVMGFAFNLKVDVARRCGTWRLGLRASLACAISARTRWQEGLRRTSAAQVVA
ncbi:hypothetical protein OH77DRAFT_282049 [Trametes cingulata]|nr:hypothetical protein OH77DRAFT_282049 [Trametes cingulata]